MIIINQDKTEIINFDNVININIADCGEDGHLISAGFIVGTDDNYRDLGYYKTEERAKEVLQEIIDKYKEYATIQNRVGSISDVKILPKVYEMPKE